MHAWTLVPVAMLLLGSGAWLGAVDLEDPGAAGEAGESAPVTFRYERSFGEDQYLALALDVVDPTSDTFEDWTHGAQTHSLLLWIWRDGAFAETMRSGGGFGIVGDERAFVNTGQPLPGSLRYKSGSICDFTGPVCDTLFPGEGGAGGAGGLGIDASGRWWVLLVRGANGPGLTDIVIEINATSVEVAEELEGPAGFFLDEDFTGGWSAGYLNGPAFLGVKEADHVHVDAAAASRMFGLFWTQEGIGSVTMGYDGPDGAHDGETYYMLDNQPPGPYRFRIDHQQSVGGLFWIPFTVLLVADVPIPESAMATAP